MSRFTSVAVAALYALVGLSLLATAAWWGRLGGWGADDECRSNAAACPDVGPTLPITPVLWSLTLAGTATVAILGWALRPAALAIRVAWAVLLGLGVCIANWHQPIWAVAVGIAVAGVVGVHRQPFQQEGVPEQR